MCAGPRLRPLPDYRYTVTEHDPERPWIVRGTKPRHRHARRERELLQLGRRALAGAAVDVEVDRGQLAPWLR